MALNSSEDSSTPSCPQLPHQPQGADESEPKLVFLLNIIEQAFSGMYGWPFCYHVHIFSKVGFRSGSESSENYTDLVSTTLL